MFSFTYWLYNSLNRRHTPMRVWLLHRMTESRVESVRRGAAWIINEQVNPTQAMLDWEFRLAQDPAGSVRVEAAEGVLMHVGAFDDVRLATVVASLQELTSYDWEGHVGRQEWFRENVVALAREVRLRRSGVQLPAEEILGPEGMRLVSALSVPRVEDLSYRVWNLRGDAWVEQMDATSPIPSVDEIRQRLHDLGAPVPLIRVSSEDDLFATIEAQLDELWSADPRAAAWVCTSLRFWLGELQRQSLTRRNSVKLGRAQ